MQAGNQNTKRMCHLFAQNKAVEFGSHSNLTLEVFASISASHLLLPIIIKGGGGAGPVTGAGLFIGWVTFQSQPRPVASCWRKRCTPEVRKSNFAEATEREESYQLTVSAAVPAHSGRGEISCRSKPSSSFSQLKRSGVNWSWRICWLCFPAFYFLFYAPCHRRSARTWARPRRPSSMTPVHPGHTASQWHARCGQCWEMLSLPPWTNHRTPGAIRGGAPVWRQRGFDGAQEFGMRERP